MTHAVAPSSRSFDHHLSPSLFGLSEVALRRLDPSACLRRALLEETPPRGRAEEVLLAWLIALPPGIDPAEAAGHLAPGAPEGGMHPEIERLLGLLKEVARYPAARLSRRRARG
ncbi:hypothetical protein KAJ83_11390 [Marivibrio halodurans]|uniref:Uncharacterized protein n=1 Tax=Marivibrio halodurans TaxID=2039722 RepID=A0A8J7RZS0_9PROT|nr:hypothetical protein [Marivibrio halodurans]MBP5857615.1 hypothetical protein [Marivibrio halodurans]